MREEVKHDYPDADERNKEAELKRTLKPRSARDGLCGIFIFWRGLDRPQVVLHRRQYAFGEVAAPDLTFAIGILVICDTK